MNVKVKLIQASDRVHRLADATVVLTDPDGDSLTVSDLRVLENKQGQTWVAMPSRSASEGGRSFRYMPLVDASRQLRRKIEDAVLTAFEQWKQSQSNSEVLA